jgi:hypothetical protein
MHEGLEVGRLKIRIGHEKVNQARRIQIKERPRRIEQNAGNNLDPKARRGSEI